MIRFPIMDPFSNDPLDEWTLVSYPTNEMDMYEEDDNLIVELKAPGFKKGDLNISIESGTLTISGKTEIEKENDEEEGRRYFKREIQKKSFTRRVNLPVDVKSDDASATFQEGMLRLTIPKVEEEKPKSKEISIE